MLDECERALFVADREGARVHRFSLINRAVEGAHPPLTEQTLLLAAWSASDLQPRQDVHAGMWALLHAR